MISKTEITENYSAIKSLAIDLLADFKEIIEGAPTEKQQMIIDRYNNTIQRCDKVLRELDQSLM